MTALRRSLAFSFGQKYALAVVSLLTTALLARLLSPREVGVFMVGTALVSMTEVFRDFGVSIYLIQAREITLAGMRTAFTVSFVLSALLSAALFGLSGGIAGFYREPGLERVLHIAALNLLMLPFSATALALLRRDMAFDAIARINLLGALAYGVSVILLAARGYGYMSLAWATSFSLAVTTAAAIRQRRELRIYWFGLGELRQVLSFGGVSSGTALLNVLYANLPQLFFGRILDFGAVGLYNRATLLVHLFDRMVLDGLNPVLLPALVARVREGGELKQAYLRALQYVTALQWPFLLCTALLAVPMVNLLLGPQWHEVAPLVRIIALPTLVIFPAFLTYPLLVATGRVGDTLAMSIVTLPVSLAVMSGAAFFGLQAVALSLFFIGPFQVGVALIYVRRQVRFTWGELVRATRKSAIVSLSAAAAPGAAVALAGFRFDLSIWQMAVAGVGAAAGWLVGLVMTGHPLLEEVRGAAPALRRILLLGLGMASRGSRA